VEKGGHRELGQARVAELSIDATADAEKPQMSTPRHGLIGYTRDKCRCSVCRAAWADYHRDCRRRRALNDGKPLGGPRKTEAERKAAARDRLKHLRAERPEVIKARDINSRTRSIGAEGRVSGTELEALVDAYSGRCAYCGRPWEVIDHFVPLAYGGASWVENLRPACRGCNQAKLARSLEEWKPWLRYEPPRAHARLSDRLLRRIPYVDFGPPGVRHRRFKFPTAGWDTLRPNKTKDGVLSGRGFRVFEQLHVPQIEQKGELVTKVVGVSFSSRSLQAPDFAAGMALVLVPDPENPHDEHAVGVWDAYRRRQAGWIPKTLSQTVAEGIQSGRLNHAMCLWEWTLNGKRVGIEILVSPGFPVPEVSYLPETRRKTTPPRPRRTRRSRRGSPAGGSARTSVPRERPS
jgi:5-methylcytosine-specific restriction endonuclease McrA